MPLERVVGVTEDLKRKEKWMRVLHKGMEVVVRPLQKCEPKGFVVKTGEVIQWKCVLLLVS